MDNLIAIGNLIRQKRDEFHLSQEELAQRLGISPVTLSAYETGLRRPTFDRAKALSDIFDIDLKDLLDINLDLSANSLNLALRAEGIIEAKDLQEVKDYIKYLKFKKKNATKLS